MTRLRESACATPSTRIVPVAGRATSLTVYWNSRSVQGTTTPSDSWPSGRCATTSTSTRSPLARSRVPSPISSRSIDSFFVRARAGPDPRVRGSVALRPPTPIASYAIASPVARSSSQIPCTAA